MARSLDGIARPASDVRAFGSAHDITAKRSGLPLLSTPPKWPKSAPRTEGAGVEHTNARTGLSRRYRDRRPGMVLCLSLAVGREKGRVPPQPDCEARTGSRTSGRQEPALSPRAGRGLTEGP